MTIEANDHVRRQGLSRWRKFQAWLAVVTEAMNYDPQSQARSTIKNLESRIVKLETASSGRDQ